MHLNDEIARNTTTLTAIAAGNIAQVRLTIEGNAVLGQSPTDAACNYEAGDPDLNRRRAEVVVLGLQAVRDAGSAESQQTKNQ